MSVPLHVVCTSPWKDSALQDCLQVVGRAPVLLIGDGTYASAEAAAEFWRSFPGERYVLAADARLRGVDVADGFIAISADRWVTLTASATVSVTWD